MADDIKIRVVVATASGKKEIKSFNASLDDMGKTAGTSSKKAGSSFQSLFGSAKKFLGVAGMAGLVIGVTRTVRAGFNRMIEKGREFESQQAELSAITGIAGDDLDFLGAQALQTSVKYGRAASEIVEANKLVASQLAEKIDFGTDEGVRQLEEVAREAVVLSQAAGIDLATAVQTTTTAINQFNLEADQTNRIINSIAAGSKFGAAEARNQSEAYRESGSVFAAANREFEELNASTQILAANAIMGRRAGTGLRNMMTIVQTEADKLAKFGIHDLNVESDSWGETLQKLQPLMGNTTALAEIFGRETLSVAQIMIQNAESVGEMTEKVTGSNVAYEQAEIRMNTYDGAVNRLSAAIDSNLIPAFTESGGLMVKIINYAAQTVSNFSQLVGWVNRLGDAHADLKDELDETQKIQKGFLDQLKSVREEMADYMLQGELTAEQEKELRDAFDSSTDAVKERITQIQTENNELDKRRKKINEQIDDARRNPNQGTGNLLQSLKTELEGLDLQLSANDNLLNELETSLSQTSTEFDTYIKNLVASREATDDSQKSFIDEKVAADSLTNAIQSLNQARENLLNKPTDAIMDMSDSQLKGMLADMDIAGLEIPVKLDTTPLHGTDSIAGLQDAIANYDNMIQTATSDTERKRLATIRDSYQEQLDIMTTTSEEGVKASDVLETAIASGLNHAIDQTVQGLVFAEGKMLDLQKLGKNLFSGILSGLAKFGLASLGGPAGGFFTKIFGFADGGLIPGFSDGGYIRGRGTGRSDSNLIMGSRGEYMLNQRSTSAMGAHRADRINRNPSVARAVGRFVDNLPHLANGGRIDMASVENAMRASRSSGSTPVDISRVVDAIEKQTDRMERMERRVEFNLSEFNAKNDSFLSNEELQGRI